MGLCVWSAGFFPGWEERGTSAEPQHPPVSQPDGVSLGEIFFFAWLVWVGFWFCFYSIFPFELLVYWVREH